MKTMNQVSLSRKWMLFFLVLLSPEILAADNLNFNYKRAGTLSLEPKLGLQARGCHSKADPIEIRVHFNKITATTEGTGSLNVTLTIDGDDYIKNYAPFKSASGKSRATDADFRVPWSVHAKGNISGEHNGKRYVAGTPESWNYPFCFSDKYLYHDNTPDNQTGTYFPIYQPPVPNYPFGTNYDAYWWHEGCFNTPMIPNDRYVWGGFPGAVPMPPNVRKEYEERGSSALTDQVFFVSHTPATPGHYEFGTQPFNESVDHTYQDKHFVYPLLTGSESSVASSIHGGDFVLTLSNRNITSLSLKITNKGASETWVWKAANDDAYKNRLYLNHGSSLGMKPLASDNSDPYFVNNFYKENRYFKGSLAAGTFLTKAYTDYINNIIPLTLPPTSDGEINLVNTDGLTFTIGQKSGTQGFGSLTFSAYGQPLKFAPIYINGKEAASAMQLRNACY
ncbi:hypothetical protein [Citrobacter braakii]|uniref:Uncharacterized protein n=1 Tax=Citrobacter braakii TaxID=57706 RepID=A0A1V8NU22_CITBR|nr:hypothetical protein [Citrobacter braakii]EBW7149082.1 hypothetical protein [Salmonella enterica subsp. enterica serovar Coeln]OQM39932.1 hypothetical protein BZK42_21985 [Citrobacter braakii]QXC16618.1 hypothetical protein I6L51_00280 [Citrobacter braakii]